jgi:hypothetical protein
MICSSIPSDSTKEDDEAYEDDDYEPYPEPETDGDTETKATS